MDQELTLQHGRLRAVVSTRGASLRRFFTVDAGKETDWIWGYSGAANKRAGQGDVLMPFPSRIRGGRYSYAGVTHQLPLNDKDGPHAIHGFARTLDWTLERADGEAGARFGLELAPREGYPFALRLEVEYVLESDGYVCRFSIQNSGATPAPVGAGFHPYFRVGSGAIDGWEARIPARELIEFENLVPTGRVLPLDGGETDFREWRRIGSARLNHCYANLIADSDGVARVGLRDPRSGRAIVVECPEAMRYLVVYSGDPLAPEDTRRSLAIEPMTCATDAFNHPAWGLESLAPGQAMRGKYRVRVSG